MSVVTEALSALAQEAWTLDQVLSSLCSPFQDRIILGSNSAFLYVGFPSERGAEDLSRYDYDFFQLERAAAEGVSVDMLGKRSWTCLPGKHKSNCFHGVRVQDAES